MLLAPDTAGVEDRRLLVSPPFGAEAGVIERFRNISTLFAPEAATRFGRPLADREGGSLERKSSREPLRLPR